MEHETEEEWPPVPSLPDVMASSWGRVHRVVPIKSKRPGQLPRPIYGARREVKPGDISMVVNWTGLGSRTVSRLVLEAFCGPPPEGAVAMHLNNDPTDNRPENLRWGTHAENLAEPTAREKQSASKREFWIRWR